MRQMAKNVLYQENTWVLDLIDFTKRDGYFDGSLTDLLSQARHLQIYASTNVTDGHACSSEPPLEVWMSIHPSITLQKARCGLGTVSLLFGQAHSFAIWTSTRRMCLSACSGGTI